MTKILVTGGAGYIGTHTIFALLQQGFSLVVLDNFVSGHLLAIDRVRELTGKPVDVVCGDIRDKALLTSLFNEHEISAVIHFAALKSVSESNSNPLNYYENNVGGTVTLLNAMLKADIKKIIFSSSATVYGDGLNMPVSESDPVAEQKSVYGTTKCLVERILFDLAQSDPEWSIGILRYFNPIGAHPSGCIGEDCAGCPNNLLPHIAQVALKQKEYLPIYGNDYPTIDGTGVRDYVHVMDVAEGHVLTTEKVLSGSFIDYWNLGTGKGHSVFEIVNAFEVITGEKLPVKIFPRRSGDVAECWADVGKIERELGWVAKRDLGQMIRDMWRWYNMNPNGYN